MACIRERRGRLVIDFYDQYGKRRWETLPEGTTKTKAKERLREIEEKVSKRAYVPPREIPLFSKVAKDWLEHKKPNVRASTWENYKSHLKNHFSEFDALKVSTITIRTVERYIGRHQKEGTNINTLRRILVTLNGILSYAVRHRYIDHNPLKDAERPRDTGEMGEDGDQVREEMTILNHEQIATLLNSTRDQKHRMLFSLAIFTGARQGELLGLKWEDVDWEKSQIHFRRTFNTSRFFPPKSKTSNRRVDVGPRILRELKKWKLACPKKKLNLVFPNKDGNPMHRNDLLRNRFYVALEAVNLPKIRFHDLRHTYASLLIEQGENINYIQSQLGHKTPTVTLNVYAHLMNPTNQEAVKRLEMRVFGVDSSKTVAN